MTSLKIKALFGDDFKKNYFQTKAITSLPSPYLGLTILLYNKYGHPYLTYLPQNFLSKLFFWKKYGSEISYLPMIWTNVQIFVVFYLDLSPYEKFRRLCAFASAFSSVNYTSIKSAQKKRSQMCFWKRFWKDFESGQ